MRRAAHPLRAPADLDPLIDRAGGARLVLLGEATHGTHEFYAWRAEITRRLVEEHDFAVVAVEGDWPAWRRVDRYVQGGDDAGASAEAVLRSFDRWPAWMWANRETAALVEWLRAHNRPLPAERRVGVYGLDLFSLAESTGAVEAYLARVDPAAARRARRAYACFDRYRGDARAPTGGAAPAGAPASCEAAAAAVPRELRAAASRYRQGGGGGDAYLDAEQNARVACAVDRYYRAAALGGGASWNVRDRHMADTLARVVAHRGAAGRGARAVVWAHNTHVGDARFTPMRRRGMVNLGQLVREAHGGGPAHGGGVLVVGFGTHRGTVAAAPAWGAPGRRAPVPPARAGTWEDVLHRAGGGGDLLLVFDGSADGGVRGLDVPRAHRAVGVVYDPGGARAGSWVPSVVPRRYDAFCYVDASRAIDTFEALGAFARDVEAAPRAASSDAPQIASPASASPQPTGPVEVQP